MPRSVRPAFAGILLFLACTSLLIVRSSAYLAGSAAQAGKPAAAPSITPEQAAPFIGEWAVTVGMNTFEATFAIAVKNDGGKVAATVSAAGQPTVHVQDISLAGKGLVLKYFTDMQGTTISTIMTLTPDGQGLRANMAIMDGQYEMSGSATKQAAVVSELQFESATVGGGRGGRGAHAAAPAPAPVVGYPRGYTVQVSNDGTNWGKPVVEGKGSGARTTITLPPTRAKFVRLPQTGTAADAPPWSIRNLRIYEAPAASAKK